MKGESAVYVKLAQCANELKTDFAAIIVYEMLLEQVSL